MNRAKPTYTATTPGPYNGEMTEIGRAWHLSGGGIEIELTGQPYEGMVFIDRVRRRNWWQRLWRIELPT